MEPTPPDDLNDDIAPEYDIRSLKGAVRGKYYERIQKEGKRTFILMPVAADLQKLFPTEEALDSALREYLKTRDATPAPATAP